MAAKNNSYAECQLAVEVELKQLQKLIYEGNLDIHRDSGYEDSGNDQSDLPSTASQLKSILRAQPQDFSDHSANRHRQHSLTARSLRRVHFYFPEGTTIPERVSTEQLSLLKWFQQKFMGAASVPWRPSAHGRPKTHEINPLDLTVDEKSRTGNYLQSHRPHETNVKLINYTNNNEEELPEEVEDSQVGEAPEHEDDTEENGAGDEENDIKPEGGDEDDENEDFKVTRRRALRRHLKKIEKNNIKISPEPAFKLSSKTRARIVATARGRHRREFPRTRTSPSDEKNVAEPLASRNEDADEESFGKDDDGEDIQSGNNSQESSRQSSIEDSYTMIKISRILDEYSVLSKPTVKPPGTPKLGRIVRTRYRRFPEREVRPGIE